MSIYVVRYSTGEWTEREEGVVAAYHERQHAYDCVRRLTDRYNQLWAEVEATSQYLNERRADLFQEGWSTDAPHLSVPDYNGYHFWFEEIEIR